VRRASLAVLALLAAGCGSSSRPATTAAPGPQAGRPAARTTARPTVAAAAAQRAALDRLLVLGKPVYCGSSRRRMVALTFDDGPGPYTHYALKELRKWHARATFFVVAKSIRSWPGWAARERRFGAAIGDHTATHPYLPGLSEAAMQQEVLTGQRAAASAAGVRVRLFRPPYGAFTPAVTATAQRLGMVEILWSIDSGDSIGGDFHAIAARVRAAVRPGSIILMHENRGQTIRALRSLLPYLRRRRLQTATVPELLAANPPSASLLAGGLQACSPGARITRFGAG